jgi:benzodiazapine receptor
MRPKSPGADWGGLVFWVALCLAAAWFGSRFEPGAWYTGLARPAYTPPAWVFAPVWTLLYMLMALAAWLVWREHGFAGAPIALSLFMVQLALNAAWSWIFFGLHRPGLALAEIQILWWAIMVTLIAFWRRRRLAGRLLLPYLLWVTFATVLNFGFWQLNP